MKTKYLKLGKKTIILTAAGTVAAQATLAQAAGKQGPGGGKLEAVAEEEKVHELRLDQIATPLDVLVPPTADFMMDFDSDEFCGSKTGYCNEGDMEMMYPDGMPPMEECDPDNPEACMPDRMDPDGMPPMDEDGMMEMRRAVRVGPAVTTVSVAEAPEIAMGPDDVMVDMGPDGPDMEMPDGGGKMPHMEPTTNPMAWASNGVIYGGDVEDFAADEGIQPKVDFVVSGIRNDQEIDLFLVYNKRKAEETEVAGLQSNQGAGGMGLPLDLGEGLQIIAGVRLRPVEPIPGMEPLMNDQLGDTVDHLRSAVISVSLKQLNEGVRNGTLPRDIYFQAVAFPAGALDFAQAQFSEVDHYIIDTPRPEEGHHGSKAEAYGEARGTGGGGKGK